MSALPRRAWQALALLLGLASLWPTSANAAFINFDNCLSSATINNRPLQLQFTPLFVNARFDRSADANYPLNITIYGNVSGQQFQGTYPPPDADTWSDPNKTFGKIADVGSDDKYTTLLSEFKVLTYTAYDAPGQQFCDTLVNGTCPLGPYFDANASNPYELPAFSIQHAFGSPYSFSTLAGTIRVLSGDKGAQDLACISANITPDLGSGITNLIIWLSAAILVMKGIATIYAAIGSPWGSSDIFKWSSNYGRDEDQLRLVTPGFGDCLQYIQFVALTGSISLQYPGFYQPVVSKLGYSLLLFNESFVSHGDGTASLIDGVYKYNGTYGMTAMSQLIGMTSTIDIWACMAVWLLVIAGIVVILCQLGFLADWIYRGVTNTTEVDLRSKNLPFTLGNMFRLLFNYFILPIVSLSLFQLVISPRSPTSVVACAVVMLVIVILAGAWILRVIFTTKPRTYLFDDMPTVLLYGPLYNTYSDSAAPFALVPVLITFMRGVAFGAIQPSGIAQIIVLAICEVILILTLNGFRPFQNQTSMNAYHTVFAVARLITILLSIAFVETLNVNPAPKGWIAYAILFIHACVLVFGFLLNALQTLVEVVARSFGVGGDAQTGAVRGSILNWRMLKKRQDRSDLNRRGSMTSDAAILQDDAYARSRSMSASSQQLLNQATGGAPSMHRMSGFENFSSAGDYVSSPSADLDGSQAGFTYMPGTNGQGAMSGKPVLSVKTEQDRADAFYRPPRARRATNDLMTPGAKTRKSGVSMDLTAKDSSESQPTPTHVKGSSYDSTLTPAYFRDRANSSNENVPHTDYAVREMDQFYGAGAARGPALSHQPTRKLKTGPADPEGPAANAQSWLQRMRLGMKGKQQEPSKGFEVVRSSRMPKMMEEEGGEEGMEMQTSPPMHQEPYQDSPDKDDGDLQARAGAARSVSPDQSKSGNAPPSDAFDFGLTGASSFDRDDDRHNVVRPSYDSGTSISTHPNLREQPSFISQNSEVLPRVTGGSHDDNEHPNYDYNDDDDASHAVRRSQVPSLGPIESFGGLDMPSRFNSRRSTNLDNVDYGSTTGGRNWLQAVDNLQWNHSSSAPAAQDPAMAPSGSGFRQPPVPRRSSRRQLSGDHTPQDPNDVFSGFDSIQAAPARTPAVATAPPRTNPVRTAATHLVQEDRPSSYASVNHRRAADSISRNSIGANAAQQGTSAEILGRSPSESEGFGRKL